MLLLPRSAPHAPPARVAARLLRRVRAGLPRPASGASRRSSALHFPHAALRWVRCNPFLSGCRPPWPPPHCLHRARTFPRCLGPLIPPRGSLLLAVHAYRSLPTGALQTRARVAAGAPRVPSSPVPRLPSTASSCPRAAVLRDISAGTSYQTVRLVFRPYAHLLPSSCTSERLRPSTGVSARVSQHRRSSLSFGSLPRHSCASAGSCSPIRLAAREVSLVRVSIRVRVLGLLSCIFTFRPRPGSFQPSLAVLLRYRSLARI